MSPLRHVSPWFLPFYVFYISFSLLALLNVITGIFVEKAMMSALQDRETVIQDQLDSEDSWVNEMRSLMTEADQDEDGTITWEEFSSHIKDERVQAYFKTLELDLGMAEDLFRLIDVGDTGSVDTEEFVLSCLK